MTNEKYETYKDVADKYLKTVNRITYDIAGNPLNIGFKIWKTYIDGFVDGRKDIAQQEIHNIKINYNQLFDEYKKLEKENAELREQIAKMRNCDNCKHYYDENTRVCDCKDYSGWELKKK